MRSSPEPIQSEDKAVNLATTTRNRLKGMRCRAAKLLAKIKAVGFAYPIEEERQHSRHEGDESDPLGSLLHTIQQSVERKDVVSKSTRF